MRLYRFLSEMKFYRTVSLVYMFIVHCVLHLHVGYCLNNACDFLFRNLGLPLVANWYLKEVIENHVLMTTIVGVSQDR